MSLFVIIFLLFISAGYGLKCDQCMSTKSWEDCATNNNVVTCPSSANRCGTANVEGKASDVTVAVYAKGCSTSSVCNSDYCKRFVSDPSTKITKCEMDCCSGDLCNIAKLPAPRHSLKCYQCSSTKGWDDCAANRKQVTCSSGFDHCGTVHVEGKAGNTSLSVYSSGCSSSVVCNPGSCKAFVSDPSTNITKCEFNCCSGNLCNENKVQTPKHHRVCYQWSSSKSWGDCAANEEMVMCSPGPFNSDRCGTVYVEGKVQEESVVVYTKGCLNSAVCQQNSCKTLFPSSKFSKCKINCCKGDLCNGKKKPIPEHRLKCFTCVSTESWDDCAKNQKAITCPFASDRCVDVVKVGREAQIAFTSYAKGCTTESQCTAGDKSRLCQYPSPLEFKECKIKCCKGGMCNRANEPRPKHSLECYQCTSLKSWVDCDSNRQVVSCPAGALRCIAVHMKATLQGNVSISVYGKGCSTAKICKGTCRAFIHDPSAHITKCKIHCCRGNLCNGRKVPVPEYSVKCYQCVSRKGWDDCASVMKEDTCPVGFDRCGTTSIVGKRGNVTFSMYAKKCTTKSLCENFYKPEMCKKFQCNISCCKGDLCNGYN